MMKHGFRSMGTTIEIGVRVAHPQDADLAQSAIEAAERTMIAMESVLSRFIPDNDIDLLNRSAGGFVDISPATCRILRRAEHAFEQGGLFNPFLGGLMEQYGYRQSFDAMDKAQPAGVRCDADVGITAVHRLAATPLTWSLDHPTRLALAPGLKIDLGGIAKGWIVEEAAAKIAAFGLTDFVINAGGDMVCRGQCGERSWSSCSS